MAEDGLLETKGMCVRLLILLALPSLTCGQDCRQGIAYHDPATGRCDSCSNICDFALQQDTVARCQTLCKGYKSTCTALQYYDINVSRCEPCDSICLQPETLADCRGLCPDWPNHTTSSTGLNLSTSTGRLHSMNVTSQRQTAEDEVRSWILTKILYIGLGVLAICCVSVLVFVTRKSMAKRVKQIVNLGRCNKRGCEEERQDTSMPLNPIVKNGRGPICSPTDEAV